MRKERVVLGHIANPSRLWRQIEARSAVVHSWAVDDDATSLGLYRAGDGLQGETFAGAGGSEEHNQFLLRSEGHVKPEAVKALVDRDLKHGHRKGCGAGAAARRRARQKKEGRGSPRAPMPPSGLIAERCKSPGAWSACGR